MRQMQCFIFAHTHTAATENGLFFKYEIHVVGRTYIAHTHTRPIYNVQINYNNHTQWAFVGSTYFCRVN